MRLLAGHLSAFTFARQLCGGIAGRCEYWVGVLVGCGSGHCSRVRLGAALGAHRYISMVRPSLLLVVLADIYQLKVGQISFVRICLAGSCC